MGRALLLLCAMMTALLMASGVAWAVTKIGTDGPDTLRGTSGADNLLGLGGNDEIFGGRGSDNLLGGPGKYTAVRGNELFPTGGDKNLVGGRGNDLVLVGQGADNSVGGAGNDLIVDGTLDEPSRDNVSCGSGKDAFLVDNKPAVKDVLTCGPGIDLALADRRDVVTADCEKVVVVHGTLQDVFRQEEGSSSPSHRASSRGCPAKAVYG
jgi:Ca2+-binding RTX toxin-like protein